jgi:hypothetical protein
VTSCVVGCAVGMSVTLVNYTQYCYKILAYVRFKNAVPTRTLIRLNEVSRAIYNICPLIYFHQYEGGVFELKIFSCHQSNSTVANGVLERASQRIAVGKAKCLMCTFVYRTFYFVTKT